MTRIGLSESPAEEARKAEPQATPRMKLPLRISQDQRSHSPFSIEPLSTWVPMLQSTPRSYEFVRAESGVLFASRYASQVVVVKEKEACRIFPNMTLPKNEFSLAEPRRGWI